VTALSWVVGVALIIQMLTWAFANFTSLRYEQLSGSEVAESAVVVTPKSDRPTVKPRTLSLRSKLNGDTDAAQPESGEPTVEQPPNETADAGPVHAADVNRATSRYDTWFRVQHQVALAAGIAGVVALSVQLLLGIVLASNGSIAGIRKIVSAQAWSMVLVALCVPWQRIAPEMTFTGLFSTYSDMTTSSEWYLAGDPLAAPGILFYGRFLLLPAAALGVTILIGLRFAAGADTGIVPAGPTPEELAIEAEASNRKAGSLVPGSGRVGGALLSTMGSSATTASPPAAPKPAPPQRAPLTSESIHTPVTPVPANRPI
jgi:hypothetical protein